jgi:hypothetical protein
MISDGRRGLKAAWLLKKTIFIIPKALSARGGSELQPSQIGRYFGHPFEEP